MKNKLRILLCIMAVSVVPLWAADNENKSVSVEQRLREIDVSLALRQYERVQMEAFETNLKLELLDTEGEMTKSERDKKVALLEKKLSILQGRAQMLRETALQLESKISVATAK
jgi:hypothetical protein